MVISNEYFQLAIKMKDKYFLLKIQIHFHLHMKKEVGDNFAVNSDDIMPST